MRGVLKGIGGVDSYSNTATLIPRGQAMGEALFRKRYSGYYVFILVHNHQSLLNDL